MLALAVLLLLGALGLLLGAVVTGNLVTAWVSIGLSVLTGLALVVRSRRAREASRAATGEPPDGQGGDRPGPRPGDEPGHAPGDRGDHPVAGGQAEGADPSEAGSAPAPPPGTADPGERPGAAVRGDAVRGVAGVAVSPPGGEPDEEDTDAADLLVVWDLADEVLVVDEHPRYHLARCDWPGSAGTQPLPVREARELGFTPCALCRPDATLARRFRATVTAES